jgi:excinuclease UvrABC ATPase subunit
VIVIEHHQAVMAHADWIIDLGPGAGHDGGRIVFEGTRPIWWQQSRH